MGLGAGLLLTIIENTFTQNDPNFTMRGYLFWFSLSLLSIRLFDQTVAWVLPLLGFAFTSFFGSAKEYQPFWNVSYETDHELLAWIFTIAILIAVLIFDFLSRMTQVFQHKELD